MTDNEGNSTTGTGSVLSAIGSAVTIVALIKPQWHWLVTLSQHQPELMNVLPYVLGPLSIIGNTISHPPAWLRTPWDDLKFWVQSFFRRKVQP